MSSHHHRSHHRHHHHRRHKAEVAGAGLAGAGIGAAAAPFLNERTGQIAQEVLSHVPKPLLTGLAAGALIGAPAGYLWRANHEPAEGFAAKVVAERNPERHQVDSPAR